MLHDNETPRKEITISGVVMKVISPYFAGHVLSDEEANVLNQTLAENLRNNFAPRVKTEKDKLEKGEIATLDVAALQVELDSYITDYEFGARRSGSVAVDPVTKIALGFARDAVKKALANSGKNVKDYTSEQIHEMAERVVAEKPRFKELAQEELARRQSIANETLIDLAA